MLSPDLTLPFPEETYLTPYDHNINAVLHGCDAERQTSTFYIHPTQTPC